MNNSHKNWFKIRNRYTNVMMLSMFIFGVSVYDTFRAFGLTLDNDIILYFVWSSWLVIGVWLTVNHFKLKRESKRLNKEWEEFQKDHDKHMDEIHKMFNPESQSIDELIEDSKDEF